MCHMLVDSKYMSKIKLHPSKTDKKRGDVLLDYFQRIGDGATHNSKFCNLLAASVKKYNAQNTNNNLWLAVKYNFKYNPDTCKKDVIKSLKDNIKN